jgi:hypothetical protein
MNTLTCAELASYPGDTLTEQLRAHHAERRTVPAAPARVPAERRPRTLPRRIDVRRFPGQTRAERVANYLRAHLPRAESWGDEAITEIASQLLRTADVVE